MENHNVKVTVIITAYNSGNVLSKAIESVIKQEFKEFELIVVDDGSDSDRCQQIVESYQKTSSFIRYIYKKNGGPAAARNRGLVEAKGEYVSFLDSDDLYKPGKLKIQYNILKKLPSDYAFVCGGSEVIERGAKKIKEPKIVSGEVYPDILYQSYFGMSGTPGHLFVKSFLLEEKFDETLRNNEDLDVLIRLSKKYKVLTHPDIVCTVVKFDNSLTRTNPADNLESSLRFIEKLEQNDYKLAKAFIIQKKQKAYFNAARLSISKFGSFKSYQYYMKKSKRKYGFPGTWRGMLALIFAFTGVVGTLITKLIYGVLNDKE